MGKLSNREKFSFFFLAYTNVHVMFILFWTDFYNLILINSLIIYSCIDILWILIDKKTNIPKSELIIHHIATIQLLNSDINIENKLEVLYIELSTLMLFILKISKGLIKKISYYLFIVSWISLRIFWLYFWFLKFKMKELNIQLQLKNVSVDTLSFVIIYLLGVKWTLDLMKITKYCSYTSVMLGIPIFYNVRLLTNQQFFSIFNLIIGSFIHHLIKNHITICFDEFYITFCCITYMGGNYYSSFLVATISLTGKYLLKTSISNQFTYVYTLIHNFKRYNYVKLISVFLSFGFYSYIKYTNTFMWHLSNGLYLTMVTYYLHNNS